MKISILQWLRDAPWITRTRLSVYPKLFIAMYVLIVPVWLAVGHGLIDRNGTPFGPDFTNSWAGSSLALAGHPQDVYDFSKIHAAEQAAVGQRETKVYGWYYPPTYLLLVLPLALMPYLWALAAWSAATIAAYGAAMWKISPRKESMWLALAFPAIWINFVNGQNGCLSAALFGAGLSLIEYKPALAGCSFGMLAYKPHLAVLIPLALLVSARWRCLFAAAATAAVFCALSAFAFGLATWQTFFHWTWVPRLVIERGLIPYCDQQSIFSVLRLWGASVRVSYAFQALAALAATIVVAGIWMSSAPFRFKAAGLVIGALLVTPYLFDYDLVLLAIPIAYLTIDGLERGFLPYEKTVLASSWVAPFIDRVLAQRAFIPLSPLLTLALLAIVATAAAKTVRGSALMSVTRALE